MRIASKATSKTVLSLATAGLLAGSLAACSSSGSSTASTSPSAGGASASPSPVAALTNLKGVSTSVKLDPGFVQALTTLKLTRVSWVRPPSRAGPSASRSPAET